MKARALGLFCVSCRAVFIHALPGRYTIEMAEFDWSFPYSSQRMPVFAPNVVATSQPLAAQAGLLMLRTGGNAIDAAVATAITLTVIEPTSNGIGADAFALIWAGGGMHGLNASGRSPKKLSPSMFADQESISPQGWQSVTVPGAVSGWVALSEQFGALPFEKLFEPAIHYARNGFGVAPQTAYYWDRGCRAYKDLDSFQQTFCPNGRGPRTGEVFTSEAHARTLELIAATKGTAFYEGELARKIVAHSDNTGGYLTEDDLAAHRPAWVRPIETTYNGATLHEIPPNGQGLTALIALGIARHLDIASRPADSAASLHLQIEAMKLAFRDADRYIADPMHMDLRVQDLLDDAYLKDRAALIDPARAQDFKHGAPKPGGTVLLCAADAAGNMISMIQSNYTGFGSGIVVPDTGIALQSRGACFVTEDGHPNQVDGGKLPYHTIIPGMVTHDGEPQMAFGVMGGYMQPQGHTQVIIRMTDYNQNPQAALDAPRWQVFKGMNVGIEPGFKSEVYDELRGLGHDLHVEDKQWVKYGGAQAIYKMNGTYCGASDLRRDGQAVGF